MALNTITLTPILQAIKKYNGPGNPTTVQNPYVFLIYKQDGRIQLTDSLRRDLTLKPLETLKLNSHFNGTWSYFYPQKEKKECMTANAW